MPTKKKQLQEYQVEKILQKRNIILFYQYSNTKVEEWEILKKSLLDAFSNNALKKAKTQLTSDLPKTFTTMIVKNYLGHRCATSVRLKAQGSILTDGKKNLEDFTVPVVFNQKKGPAGLISSRDQRCVQLGLQAGLQTQEKQGKRPPFSITGNLCKTFSNELIGEKGWGNFFQGPTLLFACDSHHQMIVGCDAINKNENQHTAISLIGGIYYGKTMTHLDLTKMCKLDQRVYASLTCSLTENIRLLLNQRLCFYQSRLLFYLDCHAAGLCCIEEKSAIRLK